MVVPSTEIRKSVMLVLSSAETSELLTWSGFQGQ